VRIEEGAGESQGIKDFWTGGELLQVEGAEGDGRFAEGPGDGSERATGSAEDGDTVLFAAGAGLLDAGHVALDKGGDLLSLRGVCGLFFGC
jgi:hypothetical protein